eukprot:18341-Rhodomonas_salina.5
MEQAERRSSRRHRVRGEPVTSLASIPARIVELLLAFRPRLALDCLRRSPLHKALQSRSWGLAHQLVASPTAPASPHAPPAASSPGSSETDLHCLVNFPDADGRTPLLLATRALVRGQRACKTAGRGREGSGSEQDSDTGELVALVEELVQVGARDASSSQGESALLAAVVARQWAVVRVLLAQRQCVAALLGVVGWRRSSDR